MKKVFTAYYVHKSNISELIEEVIPKEELLEFTKLVNGIRYSYDVIKYDKGNVTFISSDDFLTADEPIVGYCYRYKKGDWDKEPLVRKDFKHVYHSKWMFVSDTFDGFDILASKERTVKINSIKGIDKRRFGNIKYWEQFVKENNL